MPKYERDKKKSDGGDNLPSAPTVSQIVEPRCHCCTHPQRQAIDKLLAIKLPYREVERLFNVDRRSASKHAREHLNYDDAAIRQMIEHEASAANENIEEGIQGAFSRRTAIDVAIRRGFEAILNNDVVVEPKDMAKLVELREKMEKDTGAAAYETVMVQHNAFKQAVLELAPPDLKWNILERTREILNAQGAVAKAALTTGEDGTIQKPE